LLAVLESYEHVAESVRLRDLARSLKKVLVFRNPIMPTGLLVFCLDYSRSKSESLPGVFAAIRERFRDLAEGSLRELVQRVYDFRNTYIAHQKKELTDAAVAEAALHNWVDTTS